MARLILPRISISPIGPGLVEAQERIVFRDREHRPYNKRWGSCESMATLELQRWKTGAKQITLKIDEQTTTEKRTAIRTIMIDLPMAEARALARFILEAKEETNV